MASPFIVASAPGSESSLPLLAQRPRSALAERYALQDQDQILLRRTPHMRLKRTEAWGRHHAAPSSLPRPGAANTAPCWRRGPFGCPDQGPMITPMIGRTPLATQQRPQGRADDGRLG